MSRDHLCTRLASGAALLAAAALLSACSSTAAPAAAPGGAQQGIVAHGEGKVTGIPDTVTLVLGAQTQSASARDALAQNNAKTTALIAMLKAKGVAPKDLQTSELSISPMYGGSFPGGTGHEGNHFGHIGFASGHLPDGGTETQNGNAISDLEDFR